MGCVGCIGFLLVLVNYVKCDINVTDPLFKELPPIFEVHDDGPCRNHGKLYCKASITIRPIDLGNKSAHWKLIEDTIKHTKFYNHNELFHAICVNDFCPKEILERTGSSTEARLSECYGLKFAHLGLKFAITDLDCSEYENQYPPRIIDIVALLFFALYMVLIVIATYADHKKMSKNRIVTTFSLLANWKKLCSLNDRSDFQKLKFIQGIRFYNMLLVIFCHTVSSYLGGYVSNTEYFELIYRNQIRLSIATLFVFLVQTFFLISAFLLSYHVCQSMELYKESKWRYVFITFLNRYLRILAPLLLMITMTSTKWIMGAFQGPIKELYSDKEFNRCQKNWWTNLLLINNHYNEEEMCYFVTWYLAADTQLYLLSLLILLAVWKFRQRSRIILAIAISISVFISTAICYKYGLDIVYRLTPENSKVDNFRSFKYSAIYTSTFTNMASYMIGLSLGYFYFALERSKIYSHYNQCLWMTMFALLPFAVVLISSQDYPSAANIALSGLVRPCYALGIGAGILAMSQQKNGIIKKICELKPVLFLGNFTYSTYVVQYAIVFYRTATAREPLFVSDYILITSFIKDAALSIFCGFLMHILVEMPALQLQKMFMPQIRHSSSAKNCAKSD